MPNRILKESIKRSPEIDELSWFEEVVYYRLIVTADDYGCLDGRDVVLKNDLFPTKDNVTRKAIVDAISKLASVGLVCRYTANDRPYLCLPTWKLHQRLRNSVRKYPEPPKDIFAQSCGKLPQVAAKKRGESESESEYINNPPISPQGEESADLGLDEKVVQGIEEFKAFRKKIKKPMTDRAVELLASKLKKLSSKPEEQLEILNRSIMQGWTGIYPLENAITKNNKANLGKAHNHKSRTYTAQDLANIGLKLLEDD